MNERIQMAELKLNGDLAVELPGDFIYVINNHLGMGYISRHERMIAGMYRPM